MSPDFRDMPAEPASGGRPADSAVGPLREVRLCLLGFGNVARAFCELLRRQERSLADRHRLRVLVSAAGTRHGSFVAPDGVPPGDLTATAAGGLPDAPREAAGLLAASRADVLVELTVLERDHAPLATAHIERAFSLGMDVITANKGPIAWNWRRVAAAAAAAGRRLRFESTVMDGLPVFSLLEQALPDCRLLGFQAVFNATTNVILDTVAAGGSFNEALAHAQAGGYAEADPSHDVDGWDAACKAAALANVAMDAGITPADVHRQSLRDVPAQRAQAARVSGRRLRMVTSVWREQAGPAAPAGPATDARASAAAGTPAGAAPHELAGPVRARVRAEELDIDHPLASLAGESLGVVLHTDLMGDVVVCERDALLPQTAYGVYADLLHLCRTS
jgi:homoserine dehydrogenase